MLIAPSAERLALREAPPGGELAALLAPVAPATFARDLFGRAPLFVKGFSAKYRGFFDAETFATALQAPGPYPPDFVRASFDKKNSSGRSAMPDDRTAPRSAVFRASPDQATALFDAGATLCVSQLETRVATLAAFAAAVKRQLGFPGKASFNAYLSPPGSGFNWHFDARIASTLQIAGTKRWRWSRTPSVAWPRANGTLLADGTPRYADPGVVARAGELAALDENDVDEVMLEPGDLLVLPAGVWHEACGGDGGSLALNLSFTPLSYTAVAHALLDGLLAGDPAWRAAGCLPYAGDGAPDADAFAEVRAQLRRAGEVLHEVAGDDAAIATVWERLVQDPRSRPS
ncbi:MAG TPA: cupin domain-containing protein [Candidatus Baltobacteraceae bacterium]|nr:cupin domain-containing protein [Candidatus Baltobacteraceae bacterium]